MNMSCTFSLYWGCLLGTMWKNVKWRGRFTFPASLLYLLQRLGPNRLRRHLNPGQHSLVKLHFRPPLKQSRHRFGPSFIRRQTLPPQQSPLALHFSPGRVQERHRFSPGNIPLQNVPLQHSLLAVHNSAGRMQDRHRFGPDKIRRQTKPEQHCGLLLHGAPDFVHCACPTVARNMAITIAHISRTVVEWVPAMVGNLSRGMNWGILGKREYSQLARVYIGRQVDTSRNHIIYYNCHRTLKIRSVMRSNSIGYSTKSTVSMYRISRGTGHALISNFQDTRHLSARILFRENPQLSSSKERLLPHEIRYSRGSFDATHILRLMLIKKIVRNSVIKIVMF